jgi:hypothetical protein
MERKPSQRVAVVAILGARMMPKESALCWKKFEGYIRKIYKQVFHANESDRQRGTGTETRSILFLFRSFSQFSRFTLIMIGLARGIWE